MKKIIDLTHYLIPDKETFKLKIETYQAKEYIPGYKQREDDWHIIQDVLICSHVGTHVELPFHHAKDGKDAAEFPLERLTGEAIIADFTYKKAEEKIEIGEMKKMLSSQMKDGDIVILKIGWSKYYRTKYEEALHRPSPSLEAIQWLADKGMHCIGVDATGVEDMQNPEEQNIHHLLFEYEIPIIEELTNLESISQNRFLFSALPLKIKGLDSSPVRAIAIEDI